MSKTIVKRGRPADMQARRLAQKQTLLEHPDIHKVNEKVASASLNDDYNNQAVSQKLVMDRLLPNSTFEKKFDNRGAIFIRVSVNIKALDAIEGEALEHCSYGA